MTSFTANRVTRSHTIELNDVPESVFPLFTPEEEKKWAVGWDFELVYPPDGKIEENLIFTTVAHEHKQVEAIWIISQYEPSNYFIEYQRVEPSVKVGRIRIECKEENGRTLATIEYSYTALSEAGNEFVDHFSGEHYLQFIGHWEKAITHYLATGETLEHD